MKKDFLQKILRALTIKALRTYHPTVIAVTGSVGKSSAKEAIATVLAYKFPGSVRKTEKNYNNEIGVPCAVLGITPQGNSLIGWISAIIGAYIHILFSKKFPRYLVLEMGADRPGDIDYLTAFIPPDVAVITAIGEMPVHLEFFPEQDALVNEKSFVLQRLKKGGTAVLNYDDITVRDLRDRVPGGCKILTFGWESGAHIRAFGAETILPVPSQHKSATTIPLMPGIAFKVEDGGNVVPFSVQHVLGKQVTYALLAAIAVGKALGVNLVDASQSLVRYTNLPGRMNVLAGIKNTLLVDDTYNSSPLAVLAALEVIAQFTVRRTVAVLGDMMELGANEQASHEKIGETIAALHIGLFVGVGERMRFAADAAQRAGYPAERIIMCHDAAEAVSRLQEVITNGDVVLIKGSQSMRMENVTRAFLADPATASRVLVRQEKHWQ